MESIRQVQSTLQTTGGKERETVESEEQKRRERQKLFRTHIHLR